MHTGEQLTDSVTLYCGDCLDILQTLPECSVDSVVCDPPYHLTSIVNRFGSDNAAPAKVGKTGAYARASAGFMGKKWDGGDIAFQVETWRRVLRVLKPGGHLLAFGGTRTYHRMACAIEDAGLEIRDSLQFLYGSGFPKSHDVSKGIDKTNGVQVGWFGPWLKRWRAERGIAQKDIAELFPSKTGGKTGCVANWELGFNLPTPDQFNLICSTFGLPFDSLEAAEREIVGTQSGTLLAVAPGQNNDRSAVTLDVTTPKSGAAKELDGWGTALKPAAEPIVMARKPLSESTVAANVLKWGTGALNIDGARVRYESAEDAAAAAQRMGQSDTQLMAGLAGIQAAPDQDKVAASLENWNEKAKLGRWPANVIHDGSDEVVGAFPDAPGQQRSVGPANGAKSSINVYGDYGPREQFDPRDDSGSAARFFYTAKADSDDRLGSKHPTVKPLDLMQYLVRLVTPPKGTCLDPFAGTGTTGEAAIREGMRAVLIEREPEYQEDIRRRMRLAMSGPDERARESIKEKLKGKPVDHGPLFAPQVNS